MADAVPAAARWLITAATLAYGLGPFVVDMNRTHLLHPGWIGHARFHLFWAATSQLTVAAIALWLVWSDTADARFRCQVGAGIGLAMNAGFWVALVTRRAFGGTLHDPKGIPPLAGRIDGNLIAVALITGLLLAGVVQLG